MHANPSVTSGRYDSGRVRSPILALLLLAVGCSSAGETTTTTTTIPPATSAVDTTPSTTAPAAPCPEAPYDLTWLPPTVRPAADDDAAGEPDEFSSIGGTHTRLWVGSEGQTAIALVRGALPPQEWPSDRGEVEVAGGRAVAGPYPDGRWVVAWFNEPGDRCDQYTMVFYPPVSPAEVEETLANMERLPG